MKCWGRTVLDSALSQVGLKHCSCGDTTYTWGICNELYITELSINMVIFVLVMPFYLQYYFVSIPKELKVEVIRTLTADNPHIPRNIVRFSFKVSVAWPIKPEFFAINCFCVFIWFITAFSFNVAKSYYVFTTLKGFVERKSLKALIHLFRSRILQLQNKICQWRWLMQLISGSYFFHYVLVKGQKARLFLVCGNYASVSSCKYRIVGELRNVFCEITNKLYSWLVGVSNRQPENIQESHSHLYVQGTHCVTLEQPSPPTIYSQQHRQSHGWSDAFAFHSSLGRIIHSERKGMGTAPPPLALNYSQL